MKEEIPKKIDKYLKLSYNEKIKVCSISKCAKYRCSRACSASWTLNAHIKGKIKVKSQWYKFTEFKK